MTAVQSRWLGFSEGLPAREQVVLPEILLRQAAAQPTASAFEFKSTTWTYAEACEEAATVADGLRALGVRPGDLVSSWLPNGPAAIAAWLGTNFAGAVYAPMHIDYRSSIIEHALNLAGSHVLIAHCQLLKRLEGLDLPNLASVIVVGEGGNTVDLPGCQLLPWPEAIDNPGMLAPQPRELWQDMALIFTSGTTGPSKGVRCSYLHHCAYARQLLPPQEPGVADRIYLCTPLSHVAGTTAVYGMLERGGTAAIVDGFSASRFWDDIRHYRATSTFIISSMATILSKQPAMPDDRDNPLRTAYMAPLLPDLSAFERRFDVSVYSAYGMTEVPTAIHTGPAPVDSRSCGFVVDPEHYELRVVDEADIEVGDGVVGELILRHRYPWVLSSGYRDMPKATAEAWRNGWFHTGDSFCRQADGKYYLVDRKRDSIRCRGENVSSVEVEQALMQHVSVVEAAVIPVPSPDGPEDEIKAVIVAKDTTMDLVELIAYLALHLPAYMVPRYVELVDELPKTPSLRIEKYKLREQGLNSATWDRVAHGITVQRERIT